MIRRRPRPACALLLLLAAAATAQPSPQLAVEEVELPNGMRLLLLERPHTSTVAAGWAARSGSADEPAEAAGLAHLVEHLMFTGTRKIGTVDADREAKILDQLDVIDQQIREIDGATGEGRRVELEKRRQILVQRAAELSRDGELSFLYSSAGALGLNASTLDDLTFYFVTLPAEKLELWFWLEADRLREPVFRRLEREKAVIDQERKARIDASPSGPAREEIEAAFWGPSPYAGRPLGRPGSLDGIGRNQLREFFQHHYRPGNLTAALVGRFEPDRVRELAQRYFAPLPAGAATVDAPAENDFAPLPVTPRFETRCECPEQVRILYPTVGFRHPDSYPLQVLAAMLNSASGRLHRSLVLEQRIAFSASAGQHPLARAGHFSFRARTVGDATPEQLVAAWDAELADLLARPIAPSELERAQNGLAADSFRRLKDPAALMKQLLIYDGLGAWREIREWPEKIARVTGDEIRDTARRHLTSEGRMVALVRRQASPEPQVAAAPQ